MRLVAFLILIGISIGASVRIVEPTDDLNARYKKAIEDTATAAEYKVKKDLTPIKTPKAKFVAWVNDRTCTNEQFHMWKAGQDITCKKQTELWLTVVPELQDFCRKLKGSDKQKTLRLEQLLGLPPDYKLTHFLTIEVETKNVYRPCADPEIDDTQCEVKLISTKPGYENYYKWFESKKSDSNYPWTKLGYSYDWGKNGDHFGLSEYVIFEAEKDKGVTVHLLQDPQEIAEFCK